MAVPTTNTTCDIYRGGAAVSTGVACNLQPRGQSTLTTPYYTHLLLVGASVDVRDDYSPGSLAAGANCDEVRVPNGSGTKFKVVLLCRVAGSSVSWPTNNL